MRHEILLRVPTMADNLSVIPNFDVKLIDGISTREWRIRVGRVVVFFRIADKIDVFVERQHRSLQVNSK